MNEFEDDEELVTTGCIEVAEKVDAPLTPFRRYIIHVYNDLPVASELITAYFEEGGEQTIIRADLRRCNSLQQVMAHLGTSLEAQKAYAMIKPNMP